MKPDRNTASSYAAPHQEANDATLAWEAGKSAGGKKEICLLLPHNCPE